MNGLDGIGNGSSDGPHKKRPEAEASGRFCSRLKW